MASSFATLLRRLRKRYETVQEFADALGIAPSRVSRAMGSRGQPFDVKGCLKLAEVTRENPDTILRAAGRHQLADQLLRLYGPVSLELTDEEQQLLTAYHGIRHRHSQLAYLSIGKAMDAQNFIIHGTAATTTTTAAAGDHISAPADKASTPPDWPPPIAAGAEGPRRHRRG
jgi:transcriptional regulator with XRE-family HTH domain